MKEIPLTQGKFALVDDEDYDFVMMSKWSFHRKPGRNTNYAMGWRSGKNVTMHRAILGVARGQIVDHINHDGLDNRRENLRIVTDVQNKTNRRGAAKHSKTGVRGVRAHKGGYHAVIGVGGKAIYIGAFRTIEQAGDAYVAANKKYFGEHGGVA